MIIPFRARCTVTYYRSAEIFGPLRSHPLEFPTFSSNDLGSFVTALGSLGVSNHWRTSGNIDAMRGCLAGP